jgi:flagellin
MSTAQTGQITDGNTATITLKGGALSAGDVFTINVGGADYSVTATAGQTINDIAAALRTAIDAGSISNLDPAGGANAADPLVNDATITLTANGAAVAFDESGLASTKSVSQLADTETADVSIAGGTITAGDTFTVSAGGSDYTYTAVDGDTNNDVAAGLKALLDAASITNLTVTVTDADDPTSDAATLTLEADGGAVEVNLSGLASQNAAVAAGGLGSLATLSVSTSSDASTALTTIESLLSTAINAATSFGSAQKQIEGQSEFVQSLIDSMTAGIGSMVDADIEAASAKLQALQVQQQLGIQALAIANGQPQTLLALFQ